MPKKPSENLTVQAIRGMTADDGQGRDRFDSDCPGLVMRVTGELGNTSRTFYARYTVKGTGKRSMLKLGDFPELSLREARAEARKVIADARASIDPKEVKKAEALTRKEETRAILDAPTFAHFAETFIKRAKATRRRATWREDERIANHCAKHFGDRPISRIGPKAISDYLDRFITKPRTRNQFRSVLLSVFEVAIEKQSIPGANPVLSVKRSKIHKTAANPLPDDELGILLPLLDEKTQTGLIARLLLYTGQRPGHEIAGMHLGEVDFGKAVWRLPAGRAKNHRPHEVPLSKQALRTIEMAKRLSEATEPVLLFPSRQDRSIPFTSYAKPFRTIRGKAKQAGATCTGEAGRVWTVYDLKDTLLTRLRGHFPYEAVQLIPNHQNQDVTARYQGESDKLATMMREALDYWGNYCDELEGRKAKLRAVKGGKNAL